MFTKKDIQNIWKLIYTEHDLEDSRSEIEAQIICPNGVSYESGEGEFFQDDDVIDLEKIKSISIEYRNYKKDRRVAITLQHSEDGGESELIVRGENKDWVAGVFVEFEKLLNSVQPQDHWIISKKNWTFLIFGLIFGLIYYQLLNLFSEKAILTDLGDTIYLILLLFISGMLSSSVLISWVSSLWPNVEFDFGPEHTKLEKRRRGRLVFIVITFIFPIGLFILNLFI